MSTSQADFPLFSEQSGSGDETLILLHGYGVSRKSWYDLLPLLRNIYNIHMIDLMGFGDSPAPNNWEYSILNQSRAVMKYLLDNNLAKVSIVAHSYGAAVAILLLQLISEGHYIAVDKLVLIGPATYHQRLPFFLLIPSVPVINAIVRILPARFQVWLVLTRIFNDPDCIDDERITRYVGNITDPHKRKALIKTSQQIFPDMTNSDIDAIVRKISMPVLIILGECDHVIPADNIYRLRDVLDQSRLVVVENCGHSPHEESPHIVARELEEFLHCRI